MQKNCAAARILLLPHEENDRGSDLAADSALKGQRPDVLGPFFFQKKLETPTAREGVHLWKAHPGTCGGGSESLPIGGRRLTGFYKFGGPQMVGGFLGEALRRTLFDVAGLGASSDAQLLERFAQHQDEAAFAAMVRRHGPMVLRLCRRQVRHEQDAEDAFQATFLVLARRAGAIHRPEQLANWLYGVAWRVARKARAAASRRQAHDGPGGGALPSEGPVARLEAGFSGEDLRPILDEELGRLPERYRAPMVLCYLEGRSIDEVAADLGLPRGTVASRMSRARDLLRTRLARRGLALSAPALAGLLTESTAGAAVPSATLQALIPAGFIAGTGLREGAALLAKEALQGMFWSKVRWSGIFLACLLVMGTATVKWTASTAKPAANANASAGQGDEFYVRWRFDKGPPKDIRVIAGRWDWRGQPDGRKVMAVPDVAIMLPTRVPKRPFVVSVKFPNMFEAKEVNISAFWVDGARLAGRSHWKLSAMATSTKNKWINFYFVGRWIIAQVFSSDEKRWTSITVTRYVGSYPGNKVALHCSGLILEEIQLRGLRPDEIPAELRSPEENLKKMRVGPVEYPDQFIPSPK